MEILKFPTHSLLILMDFSMHSHHYQSRSNESCKSAVETIVEGVDIWVAIDPDNA